MRSSGKSGGNIEQRVRLIQITRAGVAAAVLVLAVALLCMRLGFWQLHRLEERRARNSATVARMAEPPVQLSSMMMDSAGLLFRRASVSGVYDDARTIIVAGRTYRGVPGVYVLTPLRVGNAAVLVNRGWMPAADAANVNLDGIRESSPKDQTGLIVELTRDPRPADRDTSAGFRRVWFHVGHAALQREFPYPLATYAVQLLPAGDAPRFPKRVDPPALDEGPHLGYAIQWFSFAIIAVTGWLIILLRSKSR
jgi:surfeit locus 1 family protein